MTTRAEVQDMLRDLAEGRTSIREDEILLTAFAEEHPDMDPDAKELLSAELKTVRDFLKPTHA